MNPLVVPLSQLQEMRGWDDATLARHAAVGRSTVRSLANGQRRGAAETLRSIAEALDARLIVLPNDLSTARNIDFLLRQLGLPERTAAGIRACLVANARLSSPCPPGPSPAGVRKTRSVR